ncbi:LRR receptor kinase SERK2-like isoform X2 [Miscanthus floridulus]
MFCSSPPVRGRFVLASGVRGRCTLPWRSPIYSEPAVSVRLADRLPQTNQVLLHPRELYSNHISGTYLVKLVISQTWSVLDLYLNNFTGPIPDSMEKLLKLRFLSLNNSSLSGSIPKSLTAITVLQVLDLSNNKLSGEVPSAGCPLFSTSIQTLQPLCNHQEVALPVLEQLLVEWLLAQPCYLLFWLRAELARVVMRRPLGLALPGYAAACTRSGGRASTCELQNFLGQ